MKKLIALLMACATMTCAFASCGEEKADGSSTVSDESSVSESSVDESETDSADKDEVDEDTTEESEVEDSEEDAVSDDENTEDTTEQATAFQFLEDADNTMFVGKWECEKLVVEGEEMTDFMGMPLYAVYQLDIKDDGTAVMGESLNDISDAEVSMTYEWGVISDTEMAIINDDGTAMRFTYDGTYIIGTEEGYDEQIYFVKVDEFTPFDFEAFMNEFQEGLDDVEIDDDSLTDDEYVDGIDENEVPEADETVDTVDEEDAETTEESVEE